MKFICFVFIKIYNEAVEFFIDLSFYESANIVECNLLSKNEPQTDYEKKKSLVWKDEIIEDSDVNKMTLSELRLQAMLVSVQELFLYKNAALIIAIQSINQ